MLEGPTHRHVVRWMRANVGFMTSVAGKGMFFIFLGLFAVSQWDWRTWRSFGQTTPYVMAGGLMTVRGQGGHTARHATRPHARAGGHSPTSTRRRVGRRAFSPLLCPRYGGIERVVRFCSAVVMPREGAALKGERRREGLQGRARR